MSAWRLVRLVVVSIVVTMSVMAVVTLEPVARAAAGDGAVLKAGGYMGSETCGACHPSNYRHEQRILHGKRLLALEGQKRGWNCEGCHGPAKAHAEDPINGPKMAKLGELTPSQFTGVCLGCHQKKLRKHEWDRGEHAAAGLHCLECHDLSKGMGPKRLIKEEPELCLGCHRGKRPEFSLNSHHPVVREGRIQCTDCHNQHGQMALPAGDSQQVRRECAECHTQQRGPYVFEHGTMSGGLSDGCLDCHRPHGSPNRDLLRLTGRGLCLTCHPDKITHHAGPDCISCHEGFHGSNSSPILLSP
jgi:DmsE family decaheme c-type cytochrome